MNNDQIWQAVLGELEMGISRVNFITWFKNTFIYSIKDNQVVISVPNDFTKRWLEQKYYKPIKSSIEKIIEKKIDKIEYQINLKKDNEEKSSEKKEEKNINNVSNNNNVATSINSSGDVKINVSCFGLNAKYSFNTFIVGKSTELAYAACQAIVNNPGKAYNPLFIYGGVGLGKTHLLQAIGNELIKNGKKVLYTTSEQFTNNYIDSIKSGKAKEFKNLYRNVDLLLVDDVQFMGGKDGTQEEFFHTFNELQQGDKQIVLSSDRPPKAIPAIEKRLMSRFESGMVVDVGRPDIETKIAILEKKAKEKNYIIEEEILSYIANSIQNNIRELEGALNKIVAYHEFHNIKPTLKVVKSILNDLTNNNQIKPVSPKDVLETVSQFYNISLKDLVGGKRKKELVTPRQISIYIMREELKTSYPTIGDELGGRDHTTAIHAYNKINKEKEEDEKLNRDIQSIKQLLYGSF
ncbi:MAG TPA: chromosomal replication initiator protein DnaA [bacterium]|nr:chromosomal replication initiator protein DnaA [bacterium]